MQSRITLGVGLLFAALTCLGGGCATGPQLDLPEATKSNGVLIETTGLYRRGLVTVVGIDGRAVNQTGRNLRMCAVYYDVFNEKGEKVGDAVAATSGLAAGDTWRFQALFTTPFSTPFKRIELNRVDVH